MATKPKSRSLLPLTRSSAKTSLRSQSRNRPVPVSSPVSLRDWWLKRTQGKGLGVAGFETKEGSRMRLFSSGAISKRHDSTTLETVDGITVTISGLINRSRTLLNGFSLEVCNRFLWGFPYFWEDHAVPSCGEEESAEKAEAAQFEDASTRTAETHFTVSWDDIPVRRLHDLLVCPLRGSEDCLKRETLDDVLGRLRRIAFQGNPTVSDRSKRKRKDSAYVPNSGGMEATDYDKTLVQAPIESLIDRVTPRRPKKNRTKDTHESPASPGRVTRHGRQVTSGRCQKTGHNKMTCSLTDGLPLLTPPEERRPRRRPKKPVVSTDQAICPTSTDRVQQQPQQHAEPQTQQQKRSRGRGKKNG